MIISSKTIYTVLISISLTACSAFSFHEESEKNIYIRKTIEIPLELEDSLETFKGSMNYCGLETTKGGIFSTIPHGYPECSISKKDMTASCYIHSHGAHGTRMYFGDVVFKEKEIDSKKTTFVTFGISSRIPNSSEIVEPWILFAQDKAKEVCPNKRINK